MEKTEEIESDSSSSEEEEVIVEKKKSSKLEKPKRQQTEKQKEAFAKALQKRQENVKLRKELKLQNKPGGLNEFR